MHYNRVDKELAVKLRTEGKTYPEIVSILGCSLAWCKLNLRGVEGWRKDRMVKRARHFKRKARVQREYTMPKGYYIYCAVINEEVVYVGMGKGYRCEHINSGISQCYHLNKAHFEGDVFNIFILHEGLTEEGAKGMELEEIRRMAPRFNIRGNYEFVSIRTIH